MPLQRLNSTSSINTGSGSVSGGDKSPPSEADTVSPTSTPSPFFVPAPLYVGGTKEEAVNEAPVTPTYRTFSKNRVDSSRLVIPTDVESLTACMSESALEAPLSPTRGQRSNTITTTGSSNSSSSSNANASKIPNSKSVDGKDDKFNETGFLSI